MSETAATSARTPRGKLSELYPKQVKPAKLAHFVLRTSRYEESRRWWSTVLSAESAYANDQLSFMTFDDEHHRIGIVNFPGLEEAAPGQVGFEHVAFTFGSLGELLANYRRLKGEGIEPYWCINHGPTISMYYRDPDGNKVELQHDVFETAAETDAFFAAGKYEENFMGVIFDPEAMAADFEAGVPEAVLTDRPDLPEGMTAWDMFRP